MKTAIKCLLFAVFSIGAARVCHHQTKGFRLSKIRDNCAPAAVEMTAQEFPIALAHSKFSYLGRGLQSFCFLSEDGSYVLKIFNNRYQTKISYLSYLPFQEKLRTYYEGKLKKTFDSYKLAFEELRDETGLLFLQIHPTNAPCIVTLVDPLGITHPFELHKTAFLLQKKAEPIYSRLGFLMEKGEIEEAKATLKALLTFLLKRCQKGIADNDPLVRTNFGYVTGVGVIEFDVGPFSKDPSVAQPEVYQKEITRIAASLKNWLATHYPELTPFVDEELRRLL